MIPRPGLRAQILVLTAVPLLALGAAVLWFVDRGVSARSEQAITEDLRRAAGVFEDMLAAHSDELAMTGAIIARDPRFSAVLALPHTRDDAGYRATVESVARDFRQLADPDLFEIVDTHGELVTSSGRLRTGPTERGTLATEALGGRAGQRALVQDGRHLLVVTTPVTADGRVVGALLLGREVSGALASRLRELTDSHVSFLDGDAITRTTLSEEDAHRVARALAGRAATDGPVLEGGWIAWARPLPLSGPGARQVYVLQRSLAAETAFLRSVRGHLVEIGVALLLVLALATSFLAGHLTRPIRQIVRAATAMERGDFGAPVDRARRDELGTLAARFDDMRQHQRENLRSLAELARAKSEFIAVASHELRTPISVIRGWEEILRTGALAPGAPGFESCLDAIADSCGKLERIAEKATRMAEASDATSLPAPTTNEVESLLDEAIESAQAMAPNRAVRVRAEVGPEARHAVLDRALVLQAIEQLVQNGIRFTPDGGSVEVVAMGDGPDLHVEVRDTGMGISAEVRRRLFDESFVPRDSRHHHTPRGLEFAVPGMGMGLALTRRIAESHGGHVQVQSEEGRGSVFTLVLPGALAEVSPLSASDDDTDLAAAA